MRHLAFVSLKLAGVLTAISGAGLITPALALSCIDIPGARIDPDLNSLVPYQNFGRLLPEFKSQTTQSREQHRVVIKRTAGKVYVLDNGGGQVSARLGDDGRTHIRGIVGDRGFAEDIAGVAGGLRSGPFEETLAASLAEWEIKPDAMRPVSYPPVINGAEMKHFNGPVRVAQATQALRASDLEEQKQTVEYSCSADAEYAGDPKQLATFVVVKGTIKATSTTTRHVTERMVDLTIEDVVDVEKTSLEQLAKLFSGQPKVIAALQGDLPVAEKTTDMAATVATPAAEVPQPVPPAPEPGPGKSSDATNRAAGTTSNIDGQPAATGWPTLLSLLAGLTAIVLVLLFIPQAPKPRKAASTGSRKQDEAAMPVAHVTAPVANDNTGRIAAKIAAGAEEEARREAAWLDEKALQARLEVLNALRHEADGFRHRLDAALKAIDADLADTQQVSEELEDLRETSDELYRTNEELAGTVARQRDELDSANEQVLELKHKSAQMSVRLARATAMAETSQTIIGELESASETAVGLSSEYRDKSHALQAEVQDLRRQLEGLKGSADERERQMEAAIQNNAALDTRIRTLTENYNQLLRELKKTSRERDETTEKSNNSIAALSSRVKHGEHKLEEAQQRERMLEEQLLSAISDRKAAEENAQAIRKDNMRMRVDYGVRAKLLEDNLQALSAHIDKLENLLRSRNLPVPQYLDAADIFESTGQPEPGPDQRSRLIAVRPEKRSAG